MRLIPKLPPYSWKNCLPFWHWSLVPKGLGTPLCCRVDSILSILYMPTPLHLHLAAAPSVPVFSTLSLGGTHGILQLCGQELHREAAWSEAQAQEAGEFFTLFSHFLPALFSKLASKVVNTSPQTPELVLSSKGHSCGCWAEDSGTCGNRCEQESVPLSPAPGSTILLTPLGKRRLHPGPSFYSKIISSLQKTREPTRNPPAGTEHPSGTSLATCGHWDAPRTALL